MMLPLLSSLHSGKSVGLTLWGDLASDGPAAAELDDHAERRIILQITNCRVTDYNGRLGWLEPSGIGDVLSCP